MYCEGKIQEEEEKCWLYIGDAGRDLQIYGGGSVSIESHYSGAVLYNTRVYYTSLLYTHNLSTGISPLPLLLAFQERATPPLPLANNKAAILERRGEYGQGRKGERKFLHAGALTGKDANCE